MNGKALERAALAIAAKGKPVFPCNIKKRPMTEHGYLDATLDPDIINEMFSRSGVAGIGMPTGRVSGLVVIDRDRKNGLDGIAACQDLELDLGPLPETLRQRTGSGGDQIFFPYPDGVEVPCSASKVGPGIDIRSDGGYVVLPPSVNESGSYVWLNRLQPAPLPQSWIVRLARKPRPEHSRQCPTISATLSTRYGAVALEAECMAVASEPSGGRNARLNAAAYVIGQLVAGGELVESEAQAALEQAAAACGLGDHEAQRTIQSGFNAGLTAPRQADRGWNHAM
ncbi:MAG: bifunctional DNA primase/polymerase [Proteobacteria bacterium]|nr:bifunctional DNA primase/polymerase [Pseudomonadota bacterium]